MILDTIKNPQDIKKINEKEKLQLAKEIREEIINTVAQTGGHLASNLGVVELTIALHSVFHMPEDKIVWDVGHQTYVHKIITGRRKEMSTLRQLNGIAGFPKAKESIYDSFDTGHSSTSISAALGMARARDLEGKDNHVIAVIGDGALTGGMALEALDDAGNSKTRLIVILNDNEMSISKNIGGINKLLTNLRSKKNYTKSNEFGKSLVARIPYIGSRSIKVIGKLKSSIKNIIISGMYFEEIGFRYLGPVDGHNIGDMEDLFKRAKELEGPILIHVLTKKGKGYGPAEENPDKFHGISPFNLEDGSLKGSKGEDYSRAFGEKLVSMAKQNKKIVAITAAMKDGCGLGEFQKKYPKRFFDVGIAEGHALTFAAGLARGGMIPFISIYSSFYQRGYDQVIHDICLQELPVIMCVDRAGIVGNDGETHQGLYDMAFFKLIPNITVMAPSNFKQLEEMMEFAVTLKRPIVIRYPRGGEKESDVVYKPIKYGKCAILKKGCDLSIIAIGSRVIDAYMIGCSLEKDNIMAEVIDCRFLKPFDARNILNSIKKTKRIVVMEDGTIEGGLCSSIKELIAVNSLDVWAKYYAYPDEFIKQGTIQELMKKYKVDNETIIKNIKKVLMR